MENYFDDLFTFSSSGILTFAHELSDLLLVDIFRRVPAQCSAKSCQYYHGLSVPSIGEAVVYSDGQTELP